jgi:nitrite reductase (NADH) large subunit
MKYLIIGNGVAGTTAAANIRKLDSEGSITILTDEALPFYSRIRLIEHLAKEVDDQGLVIFRSEWYESHDIVLHLNTTATDIRKDEKQVVTSNDEVFDYDRLLIATGGFSFVPPIQGADKPGVFTLRNLQDSQRILQYAENARNVLLIGGGVLGLEAGNSLRKTGHTVTVVEFFPRLLPRQMDPAGAEVLREQMESMGFTFHLDARSKQILGDERVTGLLLEDGTEINADLIIVSAGVRPMADLAIKLGLEIHKGLVVNDKMETRIPDVYAAGDLIEHRERFYGIWHAAQKQGEVAGINMTGGDAVYEGTTISNVLKVVGIDLATAGDIDAEGRLESIVFRDKDSYIYKKLVIKDDVLTGCILYGDITGYQRFLKAISGQKDIRDIRKDIENWNLDGL